MVTKKLLENNNSICIVADDGYQAIDLVDKESFDVILMDINMPKINGIETSKIIREKGYKIPIIAVTAFDEKEIKDEMKKAKINEIVTKPFKIEILLEKIEKHVSKTQ